MISISSPKATDDPFGLPLITYVRCHVRTTAKLWRQKLWRCRSANFGTVCHVACEHLTSATNILKRYWRHILSSSSSCCSQGWNRPLLTFGLIKSSHICLTRPRRFVTFYTSALEIPLLIRKYSYLLTYLLTISGSRVDFSIRGCTRACFRVGGNVPVLSNRLQRKHITSVRQRQRQGIRHTIVHTCIYGHRHT